MKKQFFKNVTILFVACFLCSACKDPQEKYESYVQKGDRFYEDADYVKARLEYRNAAKITPSSAEIIYKLGLVEEAEGNYQSALSAFLTAEQQDESFEPALMKLAEFFIIAQQYDASVSRIDKVLSINPQNAQAHALKGSIFLRQKSLRQAQSEVNLARESDPSNVIAYSVLAGIYIEQKNYEKAISVLNEGLEKKPQEQSFYILKATIYSEQNDIDAVAGVYRDMFKRFPEQIGLRYDLANILIEAGRYKQARTLYEDTVKAFPDNNDAKYKYVRFVEGEDGINDAKGEIESFIQSEPEQKVFALWLADLYARNNERDQAITTLKSIIDTDPDDWIGMNAQTTLAEIQLSAGDIAFAKNLIDLVLEKEVNNFDALFLKANLTFLQGDQRQAIAEFRAILSSEPTYLKASRMLAETLLMQNRIDLAIDTLLQALKSTPGDKGTLVRLAQLYGLRGEKDSALEILKKITDIDPNYALGWESTARIALEKGDDTKTQNAIERLKEIGGNNDMAEFLQARLELQRGNTDLAVSTLKDIIQKDVNAPIASFALSTLTEMSETRDSLQDVAAFLSGLNTQSSKSLTVLGVIQMELGEKEAAEESFRKVIAQSPKNQDAYIALARLLLQKDRTQEALKILDRAALAAPSDINASMMKAEILIQMQEYDQVIALYDEVLKRNDTNDTAINNMAHIIAQYRYQDAQALEKARIQAERFINSDNPYYLDTLGWVYARQGLNTQAQAIFARAVNLSDTPNPQIEYHYGYVLHVLGQDEAAKERLRLATSGEKFDDYDQAVALLKSIE